MLVAFNFAPQGFALCNGQTLPISQNTALFSLLGTQYGGDGRTTFALPNLQGIMPIGYGNGSGGYVMGQTAGETSVTLNTSQLPAHTHTHQGSTAAATTASPSGEAFGQGGGRGHSISYYVAPNASTQATMASGALALSGGTQAHTNMMPLLTMYYVIALQGIFPARS